MSLKKRPGIEPHDTKLTQQNQLIGRTRSVFSYDLVIHYRCKEDKMPLALLSCWLWRFVSKALQGVVRTGAETRGSTCATELFFPPFIFSLLHKVTQAVTCKLSFIVAVLGLQQKERKKERKVTREKGTHTHTAVKEGDFCQDRIKIWWNGVCCCCLIGVPLHLAHSFKCCRWMSNSMWPINS